ncbi:MAG TPA: tetratricopeptide repeat protein [Pyrinomonadaceae bacterium]|jgi:hypothetical protein
MSDPVIKGVKRSPSRPASRHSSNTSSAKNRGSAGKTATPQPLKKRSAADKAPARKATKTTAKSPAIAAAKNKGAKPAKSTPAKKSVKAVVPKAVSTKASAKATKAKSKPVPSKSKSVTRKASPATPAKKHVAAPAKSAKSSAKDRLSKATKPVPGRKHVTPLPPPRQPTQDEAAALRAFERAHKEFVRGHFGEARQLFRALVEKHAGVSEVTARARTYLTIAESRLRAEPSLPRDADSLYDRGVIELNRGDYVAAQELFERALKREPSAAHIHYGLAATRSRLGSIDSALESLHRALEIQPNLRIRAQHDQDLTALRNDPEFERLVFAPRF